jgi:hypothetical protein
MHTCKVSTATTLILTVFGLQSAQFSIDDVSVDVASPSQTRNRVSSLGFYPSSIDANSRAIFSVMIFSSSPSLVVPAQRIS